MTRTRPSARRIVSNILIGILSVFTIVVFASCQPRQGAVLDREQMFEIQVGRLENQIDYMVRDGVSPRAKTRVAMRDGLVYLSNGPANKVLIFNSFGDLLASFYNPEQNARPVMLRDRPEDGRATTRFATSYPFLQTGAVAVDSRKRILVEDRLPSERAIFDENLNVLLDRVILRFSDNGEVLNYLGQEGIGGTPFPYVEDLAVTARDEIIVVCSTMDRKLVFAYHPDGTFLYRADINLDRLPVPDLDRNYIAVLSRIAAGADDRRVYLSLGYYLPKVDQATGKEYSVGFVESRVYWLDLDSGKYEGYVTVPKVEANEAQYELLGVARGGHLFLIRRLDGRTSELLIMDDTGRVIRRRVLEMSEVDLVMRDLSLSNSGIITGLMGYEDHAEIVWWRADRLLPEE